ncbi:MAG: chemotaxis protein MotC [Methylovirgula sp.]
MRLRAVALAMSALTIAPFGASAAASKPPYQLVRSLHALQDQIVLGNSAARAAIPGLSAELAARLLSYNPSVWREPRNVNAVVTYVLSGGAPRVAQRILASGNCPADEKKLLEGALAYSEGHESRATTLLADIDPRSLDPIVGGHVALTQAALLAEKSPQKAVALLDLARVLAPGTLVEEAALRREIFLINATGDFERFISLSGEYIRRFNRSTYADNFREHFSDAIARLNISGDAAQLEEIDDALSNLDSADQLKIYLMIARASVLTGRIAVAEFAAAKAESLAAPDSTEICRARLYDGAAEIFTPGYAQGESLLNSVDAAHLSREEGTLRDAALSVSRQIHEWSQADAQTQAASLAADSVPQGLDTVMSESASTVDAAQKALADANDDAEAEQP